LRIDQNFVFSGNHVSLFDQFQTVNNFYGGQLGVEGGWRFNRWTINVRSKFALGAMQQTADVNGATHVVAADGSIVDYEGGLLALRTNIGCCSTSEFAFIPEIDLNVGWQWTRQIRLFAGHTFLWVSCISRAAEHIDPVINESVVPILSGNGPLVGPARPAFQLVETDFWAQGLNFDVELSY
jgi:hypothetical protein